jgi:hypothetical protein
MTAALLIAGMLTATVGGMWFANAQEKGKPPADPIPVGGAPQKAEKSPASTEYPLGDVSRWLPHAKSFHVLAECRYVTGPEALAKNLREIQTQFPEVKDPDPLAWTGLLPVMDVAVECAFDRSRIRFVAAWRTGDNRKTSTDVRIWDGKRAILHEQYFHNNQNSFRLAPNPKRVVETDWFVGYLNQQPPVFLVERQCGRKERVRTALRQSRRLRTRRR